MIVLDCSAGVAMVRGTDDGRALRALVLEGEQIIAPSFYRVELANVAWKLERGGTLSSQGATALLEGGAALVDAYVDEGELLVEALGQAQRLGHCVYDMLYLVLARRCAATLFTLDAKLQRLAATCGVACPSGIALEQS